MTKNGTIDEFAGFFHVKPGKADELRQAISDFLNSPARKSSALLAEATVVTGIHDIRLTIFDDDTRLLFATTFDTDWEPYVDDSLRFMTGVWPWGHFLQYTEEAPEGIEEKGRITAAQAKELLNTIRVQAAGYDNSFGDLTARNIQKMQKVMAAFEEVLDDPEASAALSHPALKPLLDLADE